MMNASLVGDDEERRVEAVQRLGILDSEPEAAYDETTALAAAICSTSTSLVNIVDDHRIWAKSAFGCDVREIPRSLGFCSHAIRQDGVFVVPDALRDERFATNPLVCDGPRWRFYAGVPIGNGRPVGTLCVMDHEPRSLPPTAERALRILGRYVSLMLQHRVILADGTGEAAPARITSGTTLARLPDRRDEQALELAEEIDARIEPFLDDLHRNLVWLRGRLAPGAVTPSPVSLATVLGDMSGLVDGIAAEVRGASAAHAARMIGETGFAAAVAWHCQRCERRRGAQCALSLPPDCDTLDPTQAAAICTALAQALDELTGRWGARSLRVDVGVFPHGRSPHAVELTVSSASTSSRGSDGDETLERMRSRLRRLGGDAELIVQASRAAIIAWLPQTT